MKVPIVTIIGKPNVGKSTFFNRMAGSRIAITSDEAGTTRDRIFYRVSHSEMDFFLVDTGGLEFEKANETIEDNIQLQARVAIQDSDLIIFMVNSREGFTKQDYQAAELLRKTMNKKPVLLAVSKCDHPLDELALAEYYKFGLGEPHTISSLHNLGVDNLINAAVQGLKDKHFLTKESEEYKATLKYDQAHLNIALVGKPNVGKSSLINALLNQEKLIVSNIPGTTRDTTDSLIKHEGKEYNFIDTAGLRRRGKIEKGIEKYSALRTLSAIERCDIAVLVLDSSQPISHQDQQIAATITEAGRGLLIVANKWDIKSDEEEDEQKRRSFIRKLQNRLGFLSWAPVVFTSAVTKKNLSKIFEQFEVISKGAKTRVPTAKLNNFVEIAVQKHAPKGTKSIRPKLFYVTQTDVSPPTFVFFVNKRKYFHFSYLRYLENQLRGEFGFIGTPIKLEYREKEARFGK